MAGSPLAEARSPSTPAIGSASRYTVGRYTLRVGIMVFMIVYCLITIVPFYFLFVRSFVSTKDSAEFHAWIPPFEEVNLNARVGNFSVFYNLDLQRMKRDLGIPEGDYLGANKTLRQVAEKYGIPEERLRDYLNPFIRYNGWIVFLTAPTFLPSLGRSVLLTIAGLLGMNVTAMLTGIALANFRRRYHMWLYNGYLLQAVIPYMVVLVPQFAFLQWLVRTLVPGYDTVGGTGRQIGQLIMMVLLYSRAGSLPIMMYTSYIGTIPQDLEDAAEIDGASRWQYIRRVLLPLMKTPAASVTIIHLPSLWNDFVRPFVYLDLKNTTLLPLIQNYAGEYSTNFQVIYAGIFLSVLPMLTLFLIFRRFFIRGQLAGAVK